MKPAPFRYLRPASVGEAIEALATEGPGAKPLAGGQSLIPAMNFRLAQPAVLIDLGRLDELRGIREAAAGGGSPPAGLAGEETAQADTGGLYIGAMTRHADIERSDVVRRRAPLLSEATSWIAHPQIRNRGTLGGSLAHADPAAELPAVMLALDARLVLQGQAGQRTVPFDDFCTGLFSTALEPDELLIGVQLPALPERTGCAFEEVARRHGDYALVGACAVLTLDADGACQRVAVTLLSVGDGPVRASSAEETLRGRAPTDEAITEAAEAAAARDVDPPADIHASANYRRQLVRTLGARALRRAASRAVGA